MRLVVKVTEMKKALCNNYGTWSYYSSYRSMRWNKGKWKWPSFFLINLGNSLDITSYCQHEVKFVCVCVCIVCRHQTENLMSLYNVSRTTWWRISNQWLITDYSVWRLKEKNIHPCLHCLICTTNWYTKGLNILV